MISELYMGKTITFYDADNGNYIKQWPNWSGEVPQVGDYVLLHFGDYNEETVKYFVYSREIDGTKPDNVSLYVEEA